MHTTSSRTTYTITLTIYTIAYLDLFDCFKVPLMCISLTSLKKLSKLTSVTYCIVQNFGGMLSRNIDRLDALHNKCVKIIIIVG